MLRFEVAILSEPGGRRYNEDACGHWASNQHLCCVLADGAGGHGGGDIASRLAVTQWLTDFSLSPTKNGGQLLSLLRRVNQAVLDGREPTRSSRDMRTTVVSLVIDFVNEFATWAHCGDSRLYFFRDGQMVEHTRDHSMVQSLLDAGVIKESEVRNHPDRSVLFSALGSDPEDLEASASELSRAIRSGDVFLLCSDGIWEHLSDDVLTNSLREVGSPEEWVSELGRLVNEITQSMRSHDNYTALAVWIQ